MIKHALLALNMAAGTPEPASRGAIHRAPPPAPPIEYRAWPQESPQARMSATLIPYSIGEPTGEEQLYLELINRARSDPLAEAIRLRNTTEPRVLAAIRQYEVDLDLMVAQFATVAPAPPLSMNAQLTAGARLHSQDMLENEFQDHPGTDGSTAGTRATAQGYPWTKLGENVFATATSVVYGHAGFEIDWGDQGAVGGMQNPPGHRLTIHNAGFREVGIGVILGTNGAFGPQVVTQDFATRNGLSPIVTGVAYYDLNGNQFYDIGEGISSVRVDVAGAAFVATTAGSGGFSVPVPGNGSYTVSFSVPDHPVVQLTAEVTNLANVKMDYVPVYQPPLIEGPDAPVLNQPNAYRFSCVLGAVGYQWKEIQFLPLTAVEGAETDNPRFTWQITGNYAVLDPNKRASGSRSFHLAHPEPEDQILEFESGLFIASASEIQFKSMLGWATSNQVAKVQISLDEGVSWQDVWSQPGDDLNPETSFRLHSVSLAALAGNEIRLRFLYQHIDRSFFPQTDPGVGFYIDDISFPNTFEVTNKIFHDIAPSQTFAFVPLNLNSHLLQIRPRLGQAYGPWGPFKTVQPVVGPPPAPVVRILRFDRSPGQVTLRFQMENLPATASFRLESAANPAGPWSNETAAVLTVISAGAEFVFTAVAPDTRASFYRIASELGEASAQFP